MDHFIDDDDGDEYLYLTRVSLSVIMDYMYKITAINRGPIDLVDLIATFVSFILR